MKPKITFKAGSRLLVVDSRDFSEIPPINQEIDLRDERYKITSYESVVVNVELVPMPSEESEAPRRTSKAKAKRVAKKQAKVAAKSKKASKTTGDGKTAKTAVRGDFYSRKSN